MKVLTGDEMRALEQEAVRHGTTTLEALMERAGTAVAQRAAEIAEGGNVLVLVGPGNNGEDGIIAASYLEALNHQVTVYTFKHPDVGRYTGTVIDGEEDPNQEELDRLLVSSAVVVDALLGIGQTRPLEGLLHSMVHAVNTRKGGTTRTLAVDLPTGVNADTGFVGSIAFKADETICMGFLKRGLVLYPGAEYAGQITLVEMGLPRGPVQDVQVELLDSPAVARLLPRRTVDSNKGTSGRLLVVGGSRDFLGAPAMVALAAYRAGAGLVEVACTPFVQQSVAAHALEPIFRPLPDVDGRLGESAAGAIEEGMSRARVVAYGPGMGLSASTVALTRRVLDLVSSAGVPAVFDADGLNALAQIDCWWSRSMDLVVTPHPGEMSRLTGRSIEDIQRDRVDQALNYAASWGAVVVLKGAGTVVASPDGRVRINPTGGPNLATAGTGDVLTGVIAGLLAQGVEPFDAAAAGVYLHGKAGDILREEHGDTGTLAGDLLPILPVARLAVMEEGKE